MKDRGLVSVIMLSKNNGRHVEETVRSVMNQTYQNWEIVFMDDSSTDDTISQMMGLMNESSYRNDDGTRVNKIRVYKSVQTRGDAISLNSALQDARGRWIAFLNVGDVWEPTKLEQQIDFMEDNDYTFSYTKFALIDEKSKERNVVIGGKEHINSRDMEKCCWPSYMTVMYNADKIGKMRVMNLRRNNDYALWLNVSKMANCHLLNECLAKQRTPWGVFGKFLLTNKLKWRYECYRIEEGMNPWKASWYTLRNGCYGMWKWMRYVERR